MKNIKIKIATLVSGMPWLYSGDATLQEENNMQILKVSHTENGEKIAQQITISENGDDTVVSILRDSSHKTYLSFCKNKDGILSISTEFGDILGKTTTKTLAIKKTQSKTYISISYQTDLDGDADIKKIQISFSLSE